MRELVYAHFGDSILDNARKAAETLYELDLQIMIDTGYIFNEVDTYPEYKRGNSDLSEYLNARLNNPDTIAGKVVAAIVVEIDGSISEIKIIKSLNAETDKELILVLSELPKFKPAKYHGKLVRCRVGVQVVFQ